MKFDNNHEITGAISQKNPVWITVSVFHQIHLYKSPEEFCLHLAWEVLTRNYKTSLILLCKNCSKNKHYTMVLNVPNSQTKSL